jgi:hypothetical protein
MADRYDRLMNKFSWASRRCGELEAAVEDFRRTQPYKISHRRDDARGEVTFFVEEVPELPVSLTLLLGDVIHNLRSKLDHLADALVSAAGGTPDKITSFPIFESLNAYQDHSRKRLDGVNQYCFQTIDNMQPYKGGWGHWAWQLHQLDIIDKHRLLLTVDTMAVGRTMTVSEQAAFAAKQTIVGPRAHAAKQYARASSSPNSLPVHVGYELGTFPTAEIPQTIGFAFDIAINEPDIAPLQPTFLLLRSFSSEVSRAIDNLARFLV